MKKSLFITLEGIEGAGKSSACRIFVSYFKQHNIPFLLTREPGGTEIAEAIRQVILQKYTEIMVPETELLLYFASRVQHVERVIKPALAAGKIVLSDRFTDASYAYQCGGRGIDFERIQILDHLVLNGFKPDYTFLLDVPATLGLQRIQNRKALDRIETESIPFFTRIYNFYHELVRREPTRFKIIDNQKSFNSVTKEIRQHLAQILA